jgi:hypothetical protein
VARLSEAEHRLNTALKGNLSDGIYWRERIANDAPINPDDLSFAGRLGRYRGDRGERVIGSEVDAGPFGAGHVELDPEGVVV